MIAPSILGSFRDGWILSIKILSGQLVLQRFGLMGLAQLTLQGLAPDLCRSGAAAVMARFVLQPSCNERFMKMSPIQILCI
jgi:hypothetical protein